MSVMHKKNVKRLGGNAMKRIGIIIGQIILLSLFAVAGGYLKDWLDLPLPGTLVGMILLFALLMTGAKSIFSTADPPMPAKALTTVFMSTV